jgi:hypothetical protein
MGSYCDNYRSCLVIICCFAWFERVVRYIRFVTLCENF